MGVVAAAMSTELSDGKVGEVFEVLRARMSEQRYVPRPHEIDCLRSCQNRIFTFSGFAAVVAMGSANVIGRRVPSVTMPTRLLFVASAGVASAHFVGKTQGSHCVRSLLELQRSPLAMETALILRRSGAAPPRELEDRFVGDNIVTGSTDYSYNLLP